MNFSSGSPPSLPSPWSHRSRQAEDTVWTTTSKPLQQPCHVSYARSTYKRTLKMRTPRPGSCMLSHSLSNFYGSAVDEKSCQSFPQNLSVYKQRYFAVAMETNPSLQLPPPAPPVHILRADTIGLFLKLPDHTFSWRLLEPPGSSRMQLTVVEVSKVGVLSLPVTHKHMHVHKAALLFFHERKSFSGVLPKKMYSILIPN